jgi:hypothetical protein
MAETTCWTKDDMPRALDWVRREAKAGLEFRAERVNLVEVRRNWVPSANRRTWRRRCGWS